MRNESSNEKKGKWTTRVLTIILRVLAIFEKKSRMLGGIRWLTRTGCCGFLENGRGGGGVRLAIRELLDKIWHFSFSSRKSFVPKTAPEQYNLRQSWFERMEGFFKNSMIPIPTIKGYSKRYLDKPYGEIYWEIKQSKKMYPCWMYVGKLLKSRLRDSRRVRSVFE